MDVDQNLIIEAFNCGSDAKSGGDVRAKVCVL